MAKAKKSQPVRRTERNHEFRRRLEIVHRPDRRDPGARPRAGETAVSGDWRIAVACDASDVVLTAAKDLQDYLFTSMDVSVPLVRSRDVAAAARAPRTILLATGAALPAAAKGLGTARSYRIVCSPDSVVVCGRDDRGAAQGSYFIEDTMNLREGPFLSRGETVRAPLFSPRMVHSGWGLDMFPDSQLSLIAHYGMDAILVMTRGVDTTTHGYLDLNDLVARAARFGLDVYIYSYLRSERHPADPGAREYYERTYGELFRSCPGARGVVLVGESVEFPSSDERTTMRLHDAPSGDGLPPTRPSPGWWPCRDYPEWVAMVRDTVRRHSPGADIVFWTYNWGWAPEKDRLALIRSLPTDITLQVTFEMFEQVRRENVTHVCVDYTISTVGPGRYFASEAAAAKKRGIRLYAMTNTAGVTWDFGTVPYEPVPFQWARRHEAVKDARRRWSLSGLMESHHFAWWPSFVAEMAKWAYWEPSPSAAETAAAIAARDYGTEAAPFAIDAWRLWSEAIRFYVPTNEDQYGPFRVGPAYPFVFHPNLSRTFSSKEIKPPSVWHAHFGSRIVLTRYQPFDDPRQSPGSARTEVEIRSLEKMLELWDRGLEALERAANAAPARKKAAGTELLGLGRFMRCFIVTVINVKRWWLLNHALMREKDPARMRRLIDRIERIGRDEMSNAEAAIGPAEADSRLGWEPSLEYMTDPAHLRWKIGQIRTVLDCELPEFRKSIALTRRAPCKR